MDNFSDYKEIEKKVSYGLNKYFTKGFSLLDMMMKEGSLKMVTSKVETLDRARKEGESTDWFIEYKLIGGEGYATNLFDIGWINETMPLTIYFKLNSEKSYTDGDGDYNVPLECDIYLDDKLMESNSMDISSSFDTDEIFAYIQEYSLSIFG